MLTESKLALQAQGYKNEQLRRSVSSVDWSILLGLNTKRKNNQRTMCAALKYGIISPSTEFGKDLIPLPAGRCTQQTAKAISRLHGKANEAPGWNGHSTHPIGMVTYRAEGLEGEF